MGRLVVLALLASFVLIVGAATSGDSNSRDHSGRARPAIAAADPFASVPAASLRPKAAPTLDRSYGKLPLAFEPNRGQAEAGTAFLAHGGGYDIALRAGEALFSLGKDTLHMTVAGAGDRATLVPQRQLPGTVNYFFGDDRSRWLTGIPTYARITARNIYPGIDLAYYGRQGALEYDFVVAPDADPGRISLDFRGARSLEVDPSGSLTIQLDGGTLRHLPPRIYQEIGGVRRSVEGRFALNGKRVGFALGAYDRTRTLVIDPTLDYSTYLGGSNNDEGRDIAVDSSGAAYVIGTTNSTNFPTANPYQATLIGGLAVFVTKLNPSGSSLAYSTYLSGTGGAAGTSIAVDADGAAYLTGGATGAFPTTAGAFDTGFNGARDAFVAKLSSSGGLTYATFLGGSSDDVGHDIAVDSAGAAYVAGETQSTNYPTANAFQAAKGDGYDAFVTKLTPTGNALTYSTYLGGSVIPGSPAHFDGAFGIAVDSPGSAYVTGFTEFSTFPTTPGAYDTTNNNRDAFVTKFTPAGTGLVYSTFMGGTSTEWARAIAIDSAGSAYITGHTYSTDFPLVLPAQPAMGSPNFAEDAFVTKFTPDGSALAYSTYLGGGVTDYGLGIAVDSGGKAHVTGTTTSQSFPVLNATQSVNAGGTDVFVTTLNSLGSFYYSSYLGGSAEEFPSAFLGGVGIGNGIAVDRTGWSIYVAGTTGSTNFPTANPFQASRAGPTDAFVARIGNPPPDTSWTAGDDFRGNGSEENPSRDEFGFSDVWWYLGGPAANPHLPASYSSLTNWDAAAEHWKPGCCAKPWVGRDPTLGAGVFGAHPGQAGQELAILGFRSPVTGTISITGGISDATAGGGDGVSWSIDKGGAPASGGGPSTTLASGSIGDGGSQTFNVGVAANALTAINVTRGDFFYLIIDPKTNDTLDSTAILFEIHDEPNLRALEVNQAVQTWRNSVPLVEGKETGVRAFLERSEDAPEQVIIGRLHGLRNGTPLPGSPLLATNAVGIGRPAGSLFVRPDVVSRRQNLLSSLNFFLPLSWRSGTVRLRFEAEGKSVDCLEPAGSSSNLGGDCAATVTFHPQAIPPRVVFVSVPYKDGGGSTVEPSISEIFENIYRLESVLPAADVIAELDTLDEFASLPASHDDINTKLLAKRALDTSATCALFCRSSAFRYLGLSIRDGTGKANNVPGTVASFGYQAGTGTRTTNGAGTERNVGAHELAHVWGRHHAMDSTLPLNPNGLRPGRCGEEGSPSAPPHTPFENVGGNRLPVLGTLSNGDDEEAWGLDTRFIDDTLTVVDPRQTFDLMSYCQSGAQDQWPSRYTYEGMRNNFPSSGPSAADRATTTSATGDFVLVGGSVNLLTDQATLVPASFASGTFDVPTSGSYRAQLLDGLGNELVGANFNAGGLGADGSAVGVFLVPLTAPATPVAKISILHNGLEIGSSLASANAPTTAIVAPTAGQTLNTPTVTFDWDASDADGGTLSSNVLYSADGGTSWNALAIDTTETSLTVDRSTLTASANARLRVVVSDGVRTATADSAQFTVANNAPQVEIKNPVSGDQFGDGQTITLEGFALDGEDGSLDGSIAWSSNRDGALGTGSSLSLLAGSLANGLHVITATATDSGSASGTATITISVGDSPTRVALVSFTARRSSAGVVLRWRTANETNIAGFNLYRGEVRVNRSLVRAKGSAAGARYRLVDRVPLGAVARYRLQVVSLTGSRAWAGGVRVGRR